MVVARADSNPRVRGHARVWKRRKEQWSRASTTPAVARVPTERFRATTGTLPGRRARRFRAATLAARTTDPRSSKVAAAGEASTIAPYRDHAPCQVKVGDGRRCDLEVRRTQQCQLHRCRTPEIARIEIGRWPAAAAPPVASAVRDAITVEVGPLETVSRIGRGRLSSCHRRTRVKVSNHRRAGTWRWTARGLDGRSWGRRRNQNTGVDPQAGPRVRRCLPHTEQRSRGHARSARPSPESSRRGRVVPPSDDEPTRAPVPKRGTTEESACVKDMNVHLDVKLGRGRADSTSGGGCS